MKAPLPIAVAIAWPIAILAAGTASAQIPDAVAAPNEAVVVSVHAEGAQVYECKAGADGKLAWQFREPIVTLLVEHGDAEGYSLAQARSGLAPRVGSIDRGHDGPEAQHQGRRHRRAM